MMKFKFKKKNIILAKVNFYPCLRSDSNLLPVHIAVADWKWKVPSMQQCHSRADTSITASHRGEVL